MAKAIAKDRSNLFLPAFVYSPLVLMLMAGATI